MATLGTPPNPYASESVAGPAASPSWGLGEATIGWTLAYATAIGVGSVIIALMGYADTPSEDLPLTVIALTYPPLWLGFVGAPIWAARYKGNGWISDFAVRMKALDVPLGLVVGFLAQLFIVPLVSYPFLRLFGQTSEDLAKPAQDLADKAKDIGAGGALLFFVIVGLLAPLAEELFYRGLLYRAIEKRSGQWWALGMSSVVFGATHFEPLQFPALTAAGAVFGYLVMRTGRLGPAIVAHMAFNTTTVVILLWLS